MLDERAGHGPLSFMRELIHFYNEGFGWICRRCEIELQDESAAGTAPSRLMIEGESESKKPELANAALARWADVAQKTLVCPRCGVTEPADVA